jgi:hypothetical protein
MRERCRIDSAGSFRPAFDNSGQLGGSNSRWTNIYLASGAIVTSDMREKTDIASVTRGLEFLRKLKPILYKWKIAENCAEGESDICSRPGKRQHFGFLAQDVKSVLDEQALDVGLYIYDSEADRHGLRYEEFIAPIVCAIQELDVKFEDLSRRLSTIGH